MSHDQINNEEEKLMKQLQELMNKENRIKEKLIRIQGEKESIKKRLEEIQNNRNNNYRISGKNIKVENHEIGEMVRDNEKSKRLRKRKNIEITEWNRENLKKKTEGARKIYYLFSKIENQKLRK